MKRGDRWLVGLLAAGALAFLIPYLMGGGDKGEARYATITVDGELYQTVHLDEEDERIVIETGRGRNVLEVHDHGIEMIEADCPDQLCLTFGHVTRSGGTIVCLPHRVLVEVVGAPSGEDEPDVIVS